MKALAAETGKMFAEEGIAAAAAKYADAPMRQAQKHKDPRGHAEFARMLGEHSSQGHAQTMFNLQPKRPTLWEMEDRTYAIHAAASGAGRRRGRTLPRRQRVPAPHRADRGALVIPRSGHTITSEEPEKFNAALAELFASAEAGRWLAHKPKN